MSGLPSSILTGEMTRVSVELLNVGQVALNSLRITSSLGPHLLLDKVGVEYLSVSGAAVITFVEFFHLSGRLGIREYLYNSYLS